MTISPAVVVMLRELTAEWERASEASDLDGMHTAGARMVGAVDALLKQHDAETARGGAG